jgi:hypothetical protein
LDQWRGQLVADLGGMDMISTQELAIVNLVVKTKQCWIGQHVALAPADIGQWAKAEDPSTSVGTSAACGRVSEVHDGFWV